VEQLAGVSQESVFRVTIIEEELCVIIEERGGVDFTLIGGRNIAKTEEDQRSEDLN
jgi:hypothetical protein